MPLKGVTLGKRIWVNLGLTRSAALRTAKTVRSAAKTVKVEKLPTGKFAVSARPIIRKK